MMKLTFMDMTIKKGTAMTLNEMYNRVDHLENEYEKVNHYIAQLRDELEMAESKAEDICYELDTLEEEIDRIEEEEGEDFESMPVWRLNEKLANTLELHCSFSKALEVNKDAKLAKAGVDSTEYRAFEIIGHINKALNEEHR